MAGQLSFQIQVFVKNGWIPDFLAERMKDLSPFFNEVIVEWAKDNETKFAAGSGASLSGAAIDPGVTWQGLTEDYFREKSKTYPDRLMVRTGSLLSSLTSPDRFFQFVSPQQAAFGTPTSPEDEMKIRGNWVKRQTVFLSGRDQRMIEEKLAKHLDPTTYGKVPYSQLKNDVERMDTEFEGLTRLPDFGGGTDE